MGTCACANVLSERNEQGVDLNPVSLRQSFLKRGHRFFRRRCLHQSPTVRNAVNVNIHADEWQATGDPQSQVGAFGADTMKSLKHGGVTGKRAAVFFYGLTGNCTNSPGLGLVKGAGRDQAINLCFGKAGNLVGCAGSAKQGVSDGDGRFVPCANGNDTGDQDLEDGVMPFAGQLKSAGFRIRSHGLAKEPDRLIDVKRSFPVGWCDPALSIGSGRSAGFMVALGNSGRVSTFFSVASSNRLRIASIVINSSERANTTRLFERGSAASRTWSRGNSLVRSVAMSAASARFSVKIFQLDFSGVIAVVFFSTSSFSITLRTFVKSAGEAWISKVLVIGSATMRTVLFGSTNRL